MTTTLLVATLIATHLLVAVITYYAVRRPIQIRLVVKQSDQTITPLVAELDEPTTGGVLSPLKRAELRSFANELD